MTGWDVMLYDGMDGMGCHGMGCDRVGHIMGWNGWDGMERDVMGRDGMECDVM